MMGYAVGRSGGRRSAGPATVCLLLMLSAGWEAASATPLGAMMHNSASFVLLSAGFQEPTPQPPNPDQQEAAPDGQPAPEAQPVPEGHEDSAASGPVQPMNVTRASVHGMVRNAATGEPLGRALVRIEGDAVAGALTDGEGRFEIPGVPLGPQVFQVMKPGFTDRAGNVLAAPTIVNGSSNAEHNVDVAREMPDLVFTMSPTNAIRGQIELSTGEPAQGIGVMLLRRSVQDGRAVWQAVTNTKTNSEGAYRLAGLPDGNYAVYTEPAMDSDLPENPGAGDPVATRSGFASVFYPDSRDLAGAGKIHVAGGEQGQANLLLTQEPFHLVRAAITAPGGGKQALEGGQTNVTVVIQDAEGHQLPYGGQYEAATRAVQAFLPDGTYSLVATAVAAPRAISFSGRERRFTFIGGRGEPGLAEGPMVGQVEFSVAGRAVTNLVIPLAAQRNNVVQLSLVRTGVQQKTSNNPQGSPLVVMLSQAGGWITDGMVSSYAEGYATGPLETTFMGPGSYWAHTNIPQKGWCESSFTAGGSSLARDPLVLSATGASALLTLTLRDDCATLKLSLPATVADPAGREEPSYTVYVIPDFDSTMDVTPITLRPSSGGTIQLDGLTPGAYHVYAFDTPIEFEYHNPEAVAALPHPGQAVTLAPGATSDVVVEVPQP